MNDIVQVGSFWLDRSNFQRYIFAQLDTRNDKTAYGLISLKTGINAGGVTIYTGDVIKLADGVIAVPKRVFDTAANGKRYEQISFSGKSEPEPAQKNSFDMKSLFSTEFFEKTLGDLIRHEHYKTPKQKEKPDHIEVVRYTRKRSPDGNVVGDFGVTMIFNVDFTTTPRTYKCRFAICDGDTFDKREGVATAKAKAILEGRSLSFVYDSSISLIENLMFDLTYKSNKTELEKQLLSALHSTDDSYVRGVLIKEESESK